MANATDAVLSAWLAHPGQRIAIGDPIAEIETDKAVVEYAAEIDGTIGRLLVDAGTRVLVGDPILVVLEDGEDASDVPVDESPGAAPVTPQASTPPAAVAVTQPGAASSPTGPTAPPDAVAAGQRTDRLFVTPMARRVAAERGIDLSLLVGTGPNGRIVRRDVDAYDALPAVATSSPQAASTASEYRDVALTGMRRAVAQRLTESKSTIPHFYVTAHVRADRLLTLRQEVNSSSAKKISVNDFLVKAVAAALVEVPAANATWNGDSIRYYANVDLAVAVAVPNGLLTPVVRGVEKLGITELSTQIAELADRAREGRLRQHELEGGSFAVSNLGMHGVDEFSAIINPPQAGILAVAAAKRQPVVDEDGQLSVGSVMTVTLSADHRVIDGALAANWIAVLVDRLQNPISLLL
jgi:pyruvate dehydrogenase E2 component (dihydrolipoamide acetyltransferase)